MNNEPKSYLDGFKDGYNKATLDMLSPYEVKSIEELKGKIRRETIEEFDANLRHMTLMPNWCYQLVREVKKHMLKGE